MTGRGLAIALVTLMLAGGCSRDEKSNTADRNDLQGQRVASRQQTIVAAGGVADAPPATQPAGAGAGGEMLAEKGSFEGYGAENYRLVDQRDEIVAVLKNGMTVIVKRMASPVVAVRGVTMAGGVYEGKWLGGGLSHLLEH